MLIKNETATKKKKTSDNKPYHQRKAKKTHD